MMHRGTSVFTSSPCQSASMTAGWSVKLPVFFSNVNSESCAEFHCSNTTFKFLTEPGQTGGITHGNCITAVLTLTRQAEKKILTICCAKCSCGNSDTLRDILEINAWLLLLKSFPRGVMMWVLTCYKRGIYCVFCVFFFLSVLSFGKNIHPCDTGRELRMCLGNHNNQVLCQTGKQGTESNLHLHH